jgi:CRISPR system Cascade subunit CasD
MSSEGHLALLFDAPLQAWGFSSRFQRRTTGLYPTKSGVVGLICAAMGLAKGQEGETLDRLAALAMTTVVIPRRRANRWSGIQDELPVRRLEDYHTVGAGYDAETQRPFITRTASGESNVKGGQAMAVVTHRQYLLDARFGVLLRGEEELLVRAAAALRNPVWGVWLGRKCCVPAAPVLAGGPFAEGPQAWQALARAVGLPDDAGLDSFERIEETTPADAHESLMDSPVSFGDGRSSGPDVRRFAARYVRRCPAGADRRHPESGA